MRQSRKENTYKSNALQKERCVYEDCEAIIAFTYPYMSRDIYNNPDQGIGSRASCCGIGAVRSVGL